MRLFAGGDARGLFPGIGINHAHARIERIEHEDGGLGAARSY